MNLQVSNRLKKWMTEKSLNATELSKELGVQKSSISHILSGRNKPSFDFLMKLKSTFPEINLDWIISGNENIYTQIESSENKNESGQTISDNVSISNNTDEKINKSIINDFNDTPNSIIIVYDDDTFKILKNRK